MSTGIAIDPLYYACVLQSGLFVSSSCALRCPDVSSPTSDCCSALTTMLSCQTNAANRECKQVLDEAFSGVFACNNPLFSTSAIALIVVGSLVLAVALVMWILLCIGKRNAAVHSGVYNPWTRSLRMTRQLRVLVWKNILLIKTRPWRFLFELLLPLVLVTPLVVLANLDTITNRRRTPIATTTSPSIAGLVPNLLNTCRANLQFVFTDGEPTSTQTSFYSSGQPVFGMFFLLSFLRFVPSVTSRMVMEKETRIAEGMRMMGMKEGPLVLSWLVTGLLQYSVVAVAMAAELQLGRVFPMASLSTLTLFFWSFLLAILSFSNLVAVFFNKSKTASIASVLVWVVAFLPFYAVQDKSIAHKYAAALSAPTAFAMGTSPNTSMLEFREHATPLRHPVNDDDDDNQTLPQVEPPTQVLIAKARSGDVVQLCGLRKTFPTDDNTNCDKVAVHALDLTMYAGQITALLGHNGAGKSTTISMLTGLYPPSGGDATVFGKSIRTHMDELRGSMGVCPQHDVLYDDLTVHQHLELYAALKNVPPDDVQTQVNGLVAEVGLTEKRHVIVRKLSGGQKRKLSVAIALIGNSRVVFLDEPTSGMDPYSRRFTWNVLQQNRADRVIVLTTHFMDEADLLGDRIAIMADGRLVCAGTSLFLKNLYGAGYNLTLVKADGSSSTEIVLFIRQFVAEASVLSTVGSELVVQLPSASSGAFPALLDGLDSHLTALRVVEYGISVTTLEQVFLRIAHQSKQTFNPLYRRTSDADLSEWRASRMGPDARGSKRVAAPVAGRPSTGHASTSFGAQYVALVQKRFRCSKRDKKGWVFMIGIPIAFLVILAFLPSINVASYLPWYKKGSAADLANFETCRAVVGNSTGDVRGCIFGIPPPSQRTCVSLGAPCQGGFGVRCPDESLSSCSDVQVEFGSANTSYPFCSSVPGFMASKSACIHDWFSHCSVSGACNATACCDATDAAVSPFAPCSSCEGNRWPCFQGTGCLRKADAKLQGVINTFLAALVIVIGFAFVPASVVVFPVKERHPHQNAKYQQVACGTSVLAYWMSLWTHDVLGTLVPVAVAVGLLPLYSSYRGDVESMVAALALFVVHVMTVLPAAYLISMRFTNHSAAQTSVLVVGLVTGALVSIFSFLCRLVDFQLVHTLTLSQLDTNYLRWVYLVFPGYQLSDGLFQIGMRKYGNPYGSSSTNWFTATSCPASKSCWASTKDPTCCVAQAFEFNVAGRSLIYGLVEIVLLSAWVLYADRHKPPPPSSSSVPLVVAADPPHLVDGDVVAEAARVARGAAASDAILLRKVHKQYDDNKVALQSLSLGIPKGECFGYLGINGAGKSTTMQILNGFLAASSGAVTVAGLDVRTQLRAARRHIGYCPQFDALHDTLTVAEELELYARLKGMADVRLAVEDKLRQFELEPFRSTLTRGLSGGNKRKVSTAIALLGNPAVLLLDEPSTGMDPAARRRMWDVLVDVLATKSCSILLTTHSMEECQALCSRIGILVSGQLKCLGSAQHLKHKFGRGFTLDIRLGTTTTPSTTAADVGTDGGVSSKVTAADMERTCMDAGMYERWDKIVRGTGDSGWVLRHYLDNEGGVPSDVWRHWWMLEDMGADLEAFVTQELPLASLVEHHAEHFRYHVPKSSGHTLTSLFSLMEEGAVGVPIEQYSLSDTTLEEIFNGMAAGQEEEREAVDGVHRHLLNASSIQAVTSYHRTSSMTRLRESDRL
ncbi:hypothetical protein B5M09_003923 [Aphanomyces astaci]|uniref:ABC transporter domain-containing protein n=1 Tax=Aphanomyces astaci TaxID=112090 RepID=A0A3R7XV89_APHAT|nr:hypothetical protein B5M09_003923 [Aphanomyces astaci]